MKLFTEKDFDDVIDGDCYTIKVAVKIVNGKVQFLLDEAIKLREALSKYKTQSCSSMEVDTSAKEGYRIV